MLNRVLLGMHLLALSFWATAATAAETAPAPPTPEQIKFFEEQVRPVLATNCQKCHGDEKQKGELRLDSRTAALAGGESGPAVVPGKPADSLLIDAINHQSFEMPPEGKLKETEIAALTEWVRQGAPWPGDHGVAKAPVKREKISDEDRAFWSFQPVVNPPVPTPKDDTWSRGDIDRFVLDRLQREGLEPASEATPEMLVRRLYFDLTGLPPTATQLDDYLKNPSPTKYEALVDELLASPHYGERWARHWLDLVRYAESDGYRQDRYRPHAWRYRDYVIASFNDDKPYDQFVREQLAGDEVAPHDPQALAATGYLRLSMYEYNAKDARTQWNFILNDITDVTADVFLGMGMSCARCHDHKFDPILQVDYFRLRAFFAPLQLHDDIPLVTPEVRAEYTARLQSWEEKTADIRSELAKLESAKSQAAARGELDRFPADIQAMVSKPREQREPLEQQLAELALRQSNERIVGINWATALKGEEQTRWNELQAQLKTFATDKPAALTPGYTVTDVGPIAPPCGIPASRRGEEKPIAPGYLTILDPNDATIEPLPANSQTTGRRTALAKWLTRPDHPLTTRVIVNRVWQQHFGRGLVGTASDFGTLGERPSHPELLDFLATKFVQEGWKFKSLHRAILTSATYRQTALRSTPPRAKEFDPANRLLWKMNTRRLEAEQIRDAMLVASGELATAAGGAGVEASQPKRSIYMKVIRNQRDPLLDVFDVADGLLTTPQRNVTTTATQALLMINSDLTLKRANAWAGQLKRQKFSDDRELVTAAYRAAFGRQATDSEANAAIDFLNSGERQKTLVDFCHALLNANEFLYID
ncbi:MAG TPA: PSD1 and planctomycete cytochrome C domain-containing protein [Pirellulaceae bacterium]|nr:PSD1 and planctomycete cytochrome C domain-containing protein [Pirellulaceae bacterium]